LLSNYLKIAIRNLKRHKLYSFINIAGLAVGLTTAILIMLWIWHELSFDQFNKNKDDLYRVMTQSTYNAKAFPETPAALADVLLNDIPGIKYVAKTTWSMPLLFGVGQNHQKENGLYVGANFLNMFTYPLLKGNPQKALKDPNNIVITKELSRKYFGNEDPIGKTVKISNDQDYQVTGVLKEIPSNSSFQFDFLLPESQFEKGKTWLKNHWGVLKLTTYVQLDDQADKAQVSKKILNLIPQHDPSEKGTKLYLESITDMHLYASFLHGKPEAGRINGIYLFSVLAIFILAIACINFMNLSTARAAQRAKEVGVKKVNGAGRGVLMLQFLGEALLMTFFSTLIALVLVKLLIPVFNQVTKQQIPSHFENPVFISSVLLVTIVTGLLAGSYPAFFLSSLKPATTLKGGIEKKKSSVFIRKGLVTFQFIISVFLIIATIVIYKQIQFVEHKNLGYNKEHLILMPLQGSMYSKRDVLKQNLLRQNGIQNVSFVSTNPINIQVSSGDLNWQGKPRNQSVSVCPLQVGYDFLKTMQIPLVSGRSFSHEYASDSTAYIINKAAANLMGMKSPVGKTIDFWLGKGHIIGVIKDYHFTSLHEKIKPMILMLAPGNASYALVRTRKGESQAAITGMSQIAKQLSPAYPFEYHFVDALYNNLYQNESTTVTIAGYFALLAILISCMGLFGLTVFMTEQRSKEFGIRKVLGASVSGIAYLVSKEYMKLVGIGFLAAVPIAWYAMHLWLDNYAYHMNIGAETIIIAGVVAVAITIATVSWQSIRAAVTNPVESLRNE